MIKKNSNNNFSYYFVCKTDIQKLVRVANAHQQGFNCHHDQKDLVAWGDEVLHGSGTELSNYYFVDEYIKNNSDFHSRRDSCRFTLSKVNIAHGKKYPKFAAVAIHGWHATYCNYFASDLRQKVFGNKLWESSGCTKDFSNLQMNKDFIKIDNTKDIAKYAVKGYFLFLISDKHIATIYPSDLSNDHIYVVQAGGDIGILPINKVWKDFNNRLNKEIIAYMYLGYLKP